MHRFYSPDTDLTNPSVTLTDPKEIHHLKNVLRLKSGDTVALFNGKGEEAQAVILSVGKNAVELKILELFASKEQTLTITLACAIPKKARFETIIEKTTELGVDEIIPLITERTEVRIPKEKADKKSARYQTIAINAAKQSGRIAIPRVHPPLSFKEAVDSFATPETLCVIPCLSEKNLSLISVLQKQGKKPQRILFLIGPEGDFSKEEVAYAVKKNCLPVSLGQNVLKVDTAAISVVAFAKLFL